MLIRQVLLAISCAAGGIAIAGGYFAFISLIGVFPKLLEKVKGAKFTMLVECLLAYGAGIFNLVYVFNIRIPISWIGYSLLCLFGGIFVGCLAGALTEVLNVLPIMSRRLLIRRRMPYIVYGLALGKLIGSLICLVAY
jgi:stage V sporulation protein AB